MTMIPDEIVEKTWREVASFDASKARHSMGKISKRQPALLAYVMAEMHESRPDAQELAVYLFYVVCRMFGRLPGHRLKKVSISQVERRADENEAMLERLENADDRFLKRAAQVEAESQPYVVRYLTEAILEGDDPDLEINEEESGLIFLVLKTVVDLLDEACKKSR